jgi:hypothetical protein
LQVRSLYVVGGRQKRHRVDGEWQQYEAALVVRVDLDTREAEPLVEYRSPPGACPTVEPSFTFKAGAAADGLLYVCTQTELLWYKLPDLVLDGYLSLPFFNDLHHVVPSSRGTLLVAVTGLDAVAEVTREGEVVSEWTVVDTPIWDRFSPTTDYRLVPSTQPHLAHPNFVFEIGADIWTSRCDNRDAICLTDPGQPSIDVGIEAIHDGVWWNGQLCFTTVNGRLALADPDTKQVVRVIDLERISRKRQILGWCRGVTPLDEHRAAVAFTRIRSTRQADKLSWVTTAVATMKDARFGPTRVAIFDIAADVLDEEIPLEHIGMNAIFSMHLVEEP